MSHKNWSWVSARSTGTSHIRSGTACEDFGACREVRIGRNSTLSAVVSDGAGSAVMSRYGSFIVARVFSKFAERHLLNWPGEPFSRSNADELVDDIRDRIGAAASRTEAPLRDYAATLVGTIIGPTWASIVHVGDGSCVFRLRGSPSWQVASWPANGEYASTTYFVTDDPEPNIRMSHIDGEVEELAVFTDGIERLVLQFDTQTAFGPFFETMFGPLRTVTAGGRDRSLSRQLRSFLDSAALTDRTDDDKTLILARRTS